MGEEKEEAASAKGSASVSLAVSRILRDASSTTVGRRIMRNLKIPFYFL
jgi:hypothetical protein